jgi:hypothetical protein
MVAFEPLMTMLLANMLPVTVRLPVVMSVAVILDVMNPNALEAITAALATPAREP